MDQDSNVMKGPVKTLLLWAAGILCILTVGLLGSFICALFIKFDPFPVMKFGLPLIIGTAAVTFTVQSYYQKLETISHFKLFLVVIVIFSSASFLFFIVLSFLLTHDVPHLGTAIRLILLVNAFWLLGFIWKKKKK